jgi:quercetin dioxygenase-like cupin family protein
MNHSTSTPEVHDLKEMIHHQPASVVSRTVVRRPAGTITFFAFDKGQGLPEHVVPYDAILYLTHGDMDIYVEDSDPIPCRQGEMAFMPANIPHGVVATTPCKMFLIMLRSLE